MRLSNPCWLCLLIFAQFGGPLSVAQSSKGVFKFRHFSAEKSFSDENIRSFFQDRNGYLWIGVDSEGLCKYDGSRFEFFSHQSSDSKSISSNYINQIAEDHHGNIWLATEKGLNVFVKESQEFLKLEESEYPSKHANSILVDPMGVIWVGREDGLLRFQPSSQKQSVFPGYHQQEDNLTRRMKGLEVTTILNEGNDTLWIGTRMGLYRYSFGSGQLDHWSHTDSPYAISDNEINALVILSDRYLLLGTDNGVNIFDRKLNRFSRLEFRDSGIFNNGKVGIVDVFIDSKGLVWIGTTTYGIITGELIVSETGEKLAALDIPEQISGLGSSYITAVYEDKNEQIWVSTKFGGLYIHDRRSRTFPFYQLEQTDQVSDQDQSFIISAAEDIYGKVWIGTRDRGLVRFDPAAEEFRDFPLYQGIDQVRRIERIYCDSLGIVWLGHKKGLNRLDPVNLRHQYLDMPKVVAFSEAPEGRLWLGTKEGLFIYDRHTGIPSRYPSRHEEFFKSPDTQISAIHCDNKGSYWFGTDKRGVFRYFPKTDALTHYLPDPSDPFSISGPTIRSISQDASGRIWIGTKSAGLNLFDGETSFTHVKESDGLSSNTVFSVIQGEDGALWVPTNNGLSRFNHEDNTFTHFTRRHGLQGNVFEKYASIKLQDHRIFIAGNNGFNLFDPREINLKYQPPMLAITTVKANSRVTRRDIFSPATIRLPYNQNIVSLEFSAMDYRDQGAIHYKYRMDGVEEDWVYAGNKNNVTYSSLSHGTYRFVFTATNADGLWSGQTLSLLIMVERPPWLTWWAKTIYIFLALGFLFLIYRIASLRAMYVHNIQTKELELRQTNELNQLKLNFFTNISHELRTPLTLILAPLEKLRKSHHRDHIHKSVTLAYKSARQLLNLTEQLMYFRKLEQSDVKLQVSQNDLTRFILELMQPFVELAESKGIELKIDTQTKHLLGWIDQDKMEKILNNLVINAMKYTPEKGQIVVGLSLNGHDKERPERKVRITVTDTGEGIGPEEVEHIFDRYYQADGARKGTGIGLEMVKSLVTLHKGQIEVKSQAGVGTRFTIYIPIDRTSYAERETLEEPTPNQVSSYPYLLPEDAHFIAVSERQINREAEYRLMIIEDNPELNWFLAESLGEDFHVETANDGEVALKKIEDFKPDIVLADIMMPKCDGLELCRRMKDDVKTSHIPVVLLTAKSLDEHQIDGFDCGADAYIIKPFGEEVLKARLKGILKNRKRILQRLKEQLVLEPAQLTDNPVDTDFLSKILEIIKRNYSNTQFSVEDFAYDLNMSRSQLFRKIKSLTDQTPTEYLFTFRIRKATELLGSGSYNIAEVAYQTGFSSPNSFTKTFKKYIGVSPSKYVK